MIMDSPSELLSKCLPYIEFALAESELEYDRGGSYDTVLELRCLLNDIEEFLGPKCHVEYDVVSNKAFVGSNLS